MDQEKDSIYLRVMVVLLERIALLEKEIADLRGKEPQPPTPGPSEWVAPNGMVYRLGVDGGLWLGKDPSSHRITLWNGNTNSMLYASPPSTVSC